MGARRPLPGVAAAVLALAFCGAARGQQLPADPAAPPQAVAAPVLTMNQDRFYAESAFGRAAQAAYEAEAAALIAENRRIEAGLEAEERALTARRATIPPADFSPLAAEFDQRVEQIRRAQDAKSRDIAQRQDERRRRFFEAAVPVLAALLADKGAVAILSNQAVILSLSSLDATDEAIRRIDAALPASALTDPAAPRGDAAPEPGPELAPELAPEPEPAPELLTDPAKPAP